MAQGWIKKRRFLQLLFLGGYVTGQQILIRIFYRTPRRTMNPNTGKFTERDRNSRFFDATEKGIDEAIRFIEREAGRTRKSQLTRKVKANVYIGVLPRTKEAKEKYLFDSRSVLWAKVVWVDVDGKDFPGGKPEALRHIQQITRELSLIPTIRVDSGNGYHLYWVMEKATNDLERIERINQGLARLLNADDCWSRTQILRVPDTRNFKEDDDGDEITKRVVAENCTGLTYRLDDFKNVEIPANVNNASRASTGRQDSWLASIEPLDIDEDEDRIGENVWTAIAEGTAGDRSEVIQSVVVRLVWLGYTDEQIVGVLINPDYGISDKPLEELERGNVNWFHRTLQRARDYVDEHGDSE